MKRVLFYRSCTGAHDNATFTPAMERLGIVHRQLPDGDGEPRMTSHADIELGVHYTQPYDRDWLGETPTWQQAGARGLWKECGALCAVLAALRSERNPSDRYLYHFQWAAAHRKKIRRVWLVSGDTVPAQQAKRFEPEFTLYGVDFMASSLDNYAVETGLRDSKRIGRNLWQTIQHAAAKGDLPRAGEAARQLELWYASQGLSEAALEVQTALASDNRRTALMQLPFSTLVDAPSVQPGRTTTPPEPFSIHLLSKAGLDVALADIIDGWPIVSDKSVSATRDNIDIDRQQVLFIDRRDDLEDAESLRALVAAAREKGMFTVSWSAGARTAIGCDLEEHDARSSTPPGFIDLLRTIAQQLEKRSAV